MATFSRKDFMIHNDYMTPKSAWEDIKDFIPKDKVIWEPFYGDGKSGEYLTEMGFNVIHQKKDFFTYDVSDSVVVSNPPFSKAKEILTKLTNTNRPFIMIMPVSKIATQYFRELFVGKDIQLIIPKKRIHFEKQLDGKVPDNWKNACNFDCFYYCWKMDLPRDIVWL